MGVTVKDIYGEGKKGIGVGGSEYALLTMCETLQQRGHNITLYNNPLEQGASCFEQKPINDFHPDHPRDLVIIFRNPNILALRSPTPKIWWSCDQQTVGGYAEFSRQVDRVVCISDFHRNYFIGRYNVPREKIVVTDLPVRMQDYEKTAEKVPNRVLFSSVPERGLDIMLSAWGIIKREVPNASLTITSDYRLWGSANPLNHQYRLRWMDQEDVHFYGALKRESFVVRQLEAQVLAYPCIYDELFCVAVAEAQVAGAYPITSNVGALRTTNMGLRIGGEPRESRWIELFARKVVETLTSHDIAYKQESNRQRARQRFDPNRIAEMWEREVFTFPEKN